MRREFQFQRGAIIIGLSALIIADFALGTYSWNRASEQAAQQELAMLQRNVNVLKADIARAREIQREIPAVKKDCEQFELALYPAASGYSSVTAELTAIAAKAGLRLEGRTYRPVEVKGRGLIEVEIDTSVNGNYRSIVSFLNGLQRSPKMYAIESLSARSDSQNPTSGGMVRVGLHIKTYFRAA